MHKPGGGRLVLCLDEFMVTDVADAMKDAAKGDAAPVPPMGGRRRSRKQTRRGRKSLFGLKY
jgi:hypothetical protein